MFEFDALFFERRKLLLGQLDQLRIGPLFDDRSGLGDRLEGLFVIIDQRENILYAAELLSEARRLPRIREDSRIR